MTDAVSEGTLLWQPSTAQQKASRMADYLRFLTRTRGLDFADYEQLYNWSTSELGDFWASIAEYFEVEFRNSAAPGPSGVLPQAHWFEGATLNTPRMRWPRGTSMARSLRARKAVSAGHGRAPSWRKTWRARVPAYGDSGSGRATALPGCCPTAAKRSLHSWPARAWGRFGRAARRSSA